MPGGWRNPLNKAVATAGGVAVAGNQNTVILNGPTRTPVGREVADHWRRISDRYRTGELLGRDVERRELTEFLTLTGRGWWGWRGAAWSGKTRLMAEVACAPPAGWRPVAFFVRRGNGDNTKSGFLRNVIPQLAVIAGVSHVELGDQPAQVALFRELLEEAITACKSNGESLLLLVDGLDEDDTSADGWFQSVLDPLPFEADQYVVVVSSRPNPQPPLPDHHPLRSDAPWRALRPAPAAKAAEVIAREDMAALLRDPIGREVAALLEATGTPLTARDLASAMQKPLGEVIGIFECSSGRSFTPIPSGGLGEPGYVFGHVTLQQMLIQDLNPDAPDPNSNDEQLRVAWVAARADALAPWRAQVRDWGQRWAQKRWPVETPVYLLEDSFPLLLDDESLVNILTDPYRHARIQSRFGSLAPALAQLRVHIGRFFPPWLLGEAPPPPINLKHVGRLLLAVHDLTRGGARVPSLLPSVFARVGDDRTAERLIEAAEDPLESLECMAFAYRDVGDTGACMRTVDRFFERLATKAALGDGAAERCARVAGLCVDVGDLGRAAAAAHAIQVTAETHPKAVSAAVMALAAVGEVDEALRLAETLRWRERFRALEDAAWTCHRLGASDTALRFADAALGLVDEFGVARHDYALAVVRLYADVADADRARAVAGEFAGRTGLAALLTLAEKCADRRDPVSARAVAIDAAGLAARLAGLEPFLHRDLPALAAVLIKTGAEQEACRILELCGPDLNQEGHALLVQAYYTAAQPERAAEHLAASRADDADIAPWIHIGGLEKLIASLLTAAPVDALEEVVDEFRAAVRVAIDDSFVRRAAVRTAIGLARHGRLKEALNLLDEVRRTRDRLVDEAHVAAAHALAHGPQWAETYEFLKLGEPSVRDLAEVADTLARTGHVALAKDVATAALRPEEAAAPLMDSLTDVAYVLGSLGDFETALIVASGEPAWRRADAYFWAADAATKRHPSGILQRIRALTVDDYIKASLMTGAANAALALDRSDDARALLTDAAAAIRTQPGSDAINVVSGIAALQAHVFGTATASMELITGALPAHQQHGPLARVAGVLQISGRTEEAHVAAALALTSTQSIVDDGQRIHVLASLVHALIEGQLPDVAQTAAADAYDLFEASAPVSAALEGYALTSFALTASAVAEGQALTGRLERTLQICERVRSHGGEPDLHRLVPALAVGGHISTARDLLAQIPAQNQEQPRERLIAALIDAGRIGEAEACLEDITQPSQRSAVLNLLAAHHAKQGRAAEARLVASQAIDEADGAGSFARPEQLLNAARTLLEIGATEQARDTAMAAFRHAAAPPSFRFSDLAVGCAQLFQSTGDGDLSRRLLGEAWRADGSPFKGWTVLADVDAPTALALGSRRWPTPQRAPGEFGARPIP